MGSEERVSEAEPSSSLQIPAFSVFPDFVVFPASWSGADASHIPALNTSSTPALRCFRPVYSITVSLTNTDLQLDVFEEVSQTGPDILALRDHYFFLGLFFDFFERLHAQAYFPVFDADNFDSYFVAHVEDV